MTIDKALVAATFAELKSKRLTARKLGISEEHVYGILRGLSDRCVRCGKAVKNGDRQCSDCRHFDRDRIREKRLERAKLGLCQTCGAQRSPLSRTMCEEHRQAHLERTRKSAEKKRRWVALQGEPGRDQWQRRIRHIQANYGNEAVLLWQDCDGCCQVCSRRHGECSVQIHHIDENRANNARENLAVLCFDCHRTIHWLLAVPCASRRSLLSWFSKHYPLK